MKNLQLTRLQELYLAGTLPHAWLFVCNDQQTGLLEAQAFSQWLLCSAKDYTQACGQCKSCKLFQANTHPDYWLQTPPADKNNIAIDDIRSVADFSTSKPQFAATKVVVLAPAHAMQRQAANALLKTLEEPASHTIYILVTSNKELLPKTIVSRCHVLTLVAALSIDNVALEAMQTMLLDLDAAWLDKSVTCSQIVEKWIKLWPHEVLYWFEILLTDMIRFKYTGDNSYARAWSAPALKLSQVLPEYKFWTILDQLRMAQYLLGHNQKPNMQLLLENMLLA